MYRLSTGHDQHEDLDRLDWRKVYGKKNIGSGNLGASPEPQVMWSGVIVNWKAGKSYITIRLRKDLCMEFHKRKLFIFK
jgi:hypothetical protein